MHRLRLHHALIPLLATLAIAPLLVHGCSCGHDLSFHIQSWLETAQQLRHGTLYPHWAFSPAWQAGEPRIIFYPPLSWMLGELLILLFPANVTPIIFTWLVLIAAGFSMHRLAREFTSPNASLLASAIYIANPYMAFNALERGAYAELMASIWIPLIFLAVLRERPTIRGLAIPLALVWLTNAPSGVMASYTIVVLALVRLATTALHNKQHAAPEVRKKLLNLAWTYTSACILGLALVGFYLVPAAYERRFVQVDMAVIENLRYQDNFLFTRTSYEPHNIVTYRISALAVALLLTTAVLIAAAFFVRRKQADNAIHRTIIALAALTAVIAFLLVPQSAFIWEYLPNLKFMQFPWRLLSILTIALSLAIALLWHPIRSRAVSIATAVIAILALSQLGAHLYRQGCEPTDMPSFLQAAFNTGHGVQPTDEYTPLNADNDVERPDSPGYWLAKTTNAPAPSTVSNPAETNPNYDAPMPFEITTASRAPNHLQLTLPQPQILVLNLRDYPSWQVIRNNTDQAKHLQRDDGLTAIPLPAGASTIDIRWHRPPDQNIGTALSACALIAFGFTFRRSRKINT